MSDQDYIPSTPQVEAAIVVAARQVGFDPFQAVADFRLWVKQQKREAWDEGAYRRAGDSLLRENLTQTLDKNPYRHGQA